MSVIRLVASPGADRRRSDCDVPAASRRESEAAEAAAVVLSDLSEDEMKIRGARISMIFQEPMTSLNPVFTIGAQIG